MRNEYFARTFIRKCIYLLLYSFLIHCAPQLKQTNLENRLHVATESPKGFNETTFQHFVDELKL